MRSNLSSMVTILLIVEEQEADDEPMDRTADLRGASQHDRQRRRPATRGLCLARLATASATSGDCDGADEAASEALVIARPRFSSHDARS